MSKPGDILTIRRQERGRKRQKNRKGNGELGALGWYCQESWRVRDSERT